MCLRKTSRGAALLAAVLLAGCTQWHYELGPPLTETRLPESGQTLAQVLAELGPPQRLSALNGGFVLAWEYWQVKEQSIGLSLGALGTDLLSLDWGNAHVSGDFLLLTFNREHLLTSSTFSQWNGQTGEGQGIQPLISLVSLTDVNDLVGYLPHNRWGATLLRPIPKAINTHSDPNSGQSGIQRRGTPTGTGQKSLEMNSR